MYSKCEEGEYVGMKRKWRVWDMQMNVIEGEEFVRGSSSEQLQVRSRIWGLARRRSSGGLVADRGMFEVRRREGGSDGGAEVEEEGQLVGDGGRGKVETRMAGRPTEAPPGAVPALHHWKG